MDNQGPKLQKPYEFLKFANPSIHMIFFPHFTIYSLNFGLTVFLALMFVVLLVYNYTKPQTDLTWNCSLFELQNKYFPKIRYDYQIWRVIISGIFHSNIAHFCLNIFGLQVYGYFV
jgi:membrane associated rhomboid family serine protease